MEQEESLLSRLRTAGYTTPSLTKFLLFLITDWGIIFGAAGLVTMWTNPATILLALILIGNRQHALAALIHEGAHHLACKNKKLNDLLVNLTCSLPFWVLLRPYRKFHAMHHRSLGTPEDSEIPLFQHHKTEWDLPLTQKKLGILILKDLFMLQGVINIYHLFMIMKQTIPQIAIVTAYNILLHGTIYLLTGSWTFSALWFGSFFTTFWAFFRFRIWMEHKGTPTTHRLKLTFWEGELFSPHNMWYHYEHHEHAGVPQYYYPELREMMNDDTPLLNLREWYKIVSHQPG